MSLFNSLSTCHFKALVLYIIIVFIFTNIFRALCVSNTFVTDLGVKWLCGYSDDGAFVHGCKLLLSLFVRSTNVTLNGVRLAMETLESLHFLDYEDPLPEVTDAHVVRPTITLISFKCYRQGAVFLKNRLFLTKDSEIINYSLEPIVTDQHLAEAVDSMREFEINPRERLMAGNDRFVTFAGGIVPFLNTFGHSLQEIKLTSFDEVDLLFVLRACPRLTTLNMDSNARYTPSLPLPQTSPILECFVYCGQQGNGQCIGGPELISILKSPRLKHLEFQNCHQLTDSILQTAFNIHRFSKLEILILRNCHNLSSESFTSVFLSQINSLNVVVLDSCRQLCSNANQIQWSDLKVTNKWDLNFTMKFVDSPERAMRL